MHTVWQKCIWSYNLLFHEILKESSNGLSDLRSEWWTLNFAAYISCIYAWAYIWYPVSHWYRDCTMSWRHQMSQFSTTQQHNTTQGICTLPSLKRASQQIAHGAKYVYMYHHQPQALCHHTCAQKQTITKHVRQYSHHHYVSCVSNSKNTPNADYVQIDSITCKHQGRILCNHKHHMSACLPVFPISHAIGLISLIWWHALWFISWAPCIMKNKMHACFVSFWKHKHAHATDLMCWTWYAFIQSIINTRACKAPKASDSSPMMHLAMIVYARQAMHIILTTYDGAMCFHKSLYTM